MYRIELIDYRPNKDKIICRIQDGDGPEKTLDREALFPAALKIAREKVQVSQKDVDAEIQIRKNNIDASSIGDKRADAMKSKLTTKESKTAIKAALKETLADAVAREAVRDKLDAISSAIKSAANGILEQG